MIACSGQGTADRYMFSRAISSATRVRISSASSRLCLASLSTCRMALAEHAGPGHATTLGCARRHGQTRAAHRFQDPIGLQLPVGPGHRVGIDHQLPGHFADAGHQVPHVEEFLGDGEIHLPDDLVVDCHPVMRVYSIEHGRTSCAIMLLHYTTEAWQSSVWPRLAINWRNKQQMPAGVGVGRVWAAQNAAWWAARGVAATTDILSEAATAGTGIHGDGDKQA